MYTYYYDEEGEPNITFYNETHVLMTDVDGSSCLLYLPPEEEDYGCRVYDIRQNVTGENIPGHQFFNAFLPIICISGIIGIILTVIVLSRKNMATSTNAYLTFLAIADLGFLTFLSTKLFDVSKLTWSQYYMYIIYSEYAGIFVHTFMLASVWLTVMLAIERYIAICFPLRAISICTTRRARIIICFIFVASFLCRVPIFFEFRVAESLSSMCDDAKTVYHLEHTDLGLDSNYKIIYTWVVDCSLCAVLPFLLLLYFNIRLIMEIHKSTKYLRYHLGVDSNMQTMVSSEQIKITMMLVGIIIAFFVCQAPYVVAVAYRNLYPEAIQAVSTNIIVIVTIILSALKSAFNFIIYCWFSEKFWNTFKRVFCHRNCLSKHKLQIKNHTNTVHSADQNGGNSIRKPSYLTKDTVC
ncbi:hypothetical protein FSP39_009628 [Pinctada imbricata]|uniref:G-protein coupled receptors family 1 profile domain-containing protein n=1 Tax=Pinctada imbricata TaxID=66713 RepID=A0AA89C189_PINIB|nr:hypothetical protein FSP39_009628 [Pinctada imbricata]